MTFTAAYPQAYPAFPQPEDSSTVIWRYLDFWKFKSLVECGRFVMPNARSFKDLLEGTRPLGDLEWWHSLARNATSDDQARTIEHNSALISRFAAEFRNNYYVSCWHINSLENPVMWHKYTSQPESAAIWTTYRALREVLPRYVEIGLVRYIDYRKDRIPSMNMFQYITHKRACYSFERELRAVAYRPAVPELGAAHFDENLFEREDTKEFPAYAPKIDIHSLIHGIVLHPEAPRKFRAEFEEFCATYNLPCPA